MKKYTCASFFSGVGGIDIGFEKTGHFKTIYANEFDSFPAKTMENNFNLKIDIKDIKEVKPNDFEDVDVIMGGFPCQAFSIAGYRKGFEDDKGRGTLFFELLRLIKAKKPNVVFLENVKNLVGHDNGNTFKVIKKSLEAEGYLVRDKVLNASEYGNIPQNRERIYIVGFLYESDCKNFEFPDPIERTARLKDVIDFDKKVDDKYYYVKGKYKDSIYNEVMKCVDDENYVYQWRRRYVRKNKSGVVPTLTANMGEGGHNVPLVKTKYGVRKLTPYECFRVQGFPPTFRYAVDVPDSKLYKQAGNSVCVTVIQRIAFNIYKAIKLTNNRKNSSVKIKEIKKYASKQKKNDRIVIEKMLDKIGTR